MVFKLKEDLLNLFNDISLEISDCKTALDLEDIRINSLGKKGSITLYLKKIKDYDQNIHPPLLIILPYKYGRGVCFSKCESGETSLFFITRNCF